MKLTSRGRYTLQAMIDLVNHANGKAVKLQDIATRQNISLHYLEQLFRKLRQSGVIRSVRGPGGGYVLARVAEEITIKDIFAGVKEKIEYSNTVQVSENQTPELMQLVSYLEDLDKNLVQALETPLSKLVRV